MADSQVEEMKKAYAGIMLNMAQESAARVLAAERRAAALAAALEAAKEDGVAALLRVKAIMEARLKEKELESSVHVKKVKELEEQLHGSQAAMASLNVELQRANTELEVTRKTLADERINSLPTSNNVYSNKNARPRSKIHQQGGNILLKNKKAADNSDGTCLVPITETENEAVENLEDMDRRSPDLPSLMERNKKAKFSHNGCTQRIHALKQQTQSTGAFLKQNQKQATALNSRSKARKNNAAKNTSHTRSITEQILQTKFLGNFKRKRGRRSRPSNKHDNSSEHGEAEYKLSDKSESDGNGCLLLLQAIEQDLSPLKMFAEHDGEALTDLKEDFKMSNRDAELSRCAAFPELIDVLAVNSVQMRRRKRTKTVRVLEVDFSGTKSVSEPVNTQLRSSEKSMSGNQLIPEMTENNYSDTPTRNSGSLLKCAMHQTDAGNGQFDPEISSAVFLQSTKTETTESGNLVVDQQELITPNKNTASLKEVNEDGSCTLASPKADASTPTSIDKEKLKLSSGLPMQALEKHDISVGSSLNEKEHTKASSGASMQAEGARHIKYTFNRRKRKGMSIDSTPQRAVPEESSDLCSPTNNQKLHPDHVEQDHLIDSRQDDSQLVQLAEQLIFLSEHM